MCNQKDAFTLSIGCSYLIRHRKAMVNLLLMVPISCHTAICQQVALFLTRWTAEQARPSMTSWLQLTNADQSLGITDRTGGKTVSLCGTLLQSFLYICLQLQFRIGLRGFSAGLGEARPKERKQPGETSCFPETGLKCWQLFSSQLEDRSVCNESDSWHSDVQNTYTSTDILTTLCGEKIVHLLNVLVECVRVALSL